MANDGPSRSCALRMKHPSVGSPLSQCAGFKPLRTSSPSPRISPRAVKLIPNRRAPEWHQLESPTALGIETHSAVPSVVLPLSLRERLLPALSAHEST